MLDYIIGAVLCAGVVWLLYWIFFFRAAFVWDYDEAELQDLKEFKEGMTLEEAHKHRDKVLRKAGQY